MAGMKFLIRRASLKDAPSIAKVTVDTWRSTYKGIISDEFLSNMSYERMQRNWEEALRNKSGSTDVFVAEHNGNIVGFAWCGPARGKHGELQGEIYAIYVIQKMQRKGIGKKLTLEVVNSLKNRGFTSMIVWVLTKNPYKRFYESLGAKLTSKKYIEIGGKKLEEQGYTWDDLDSLVLTPSSAKKPLSLTYPLFSSNNMDS